MSISLIPSTVEGEELEAAQKFQQALEKGAPRKTQWPVVGG